MKEIKLTQGMVALVDDEDFESLSKFKWYADRRNGKFYARRDEWDDGECKKIYMHRYIMGLEDPSLLCDHRNANGLHNYRSNLRVATASQNGANKSARDGGTSRYKGVSWASWAKKWRAEIRFNGIRKRIGYFHSEVEAALMYNEWAERLHGEFANLNSIK